MDYVKLTDLEWRLAICDAVTVLLRLVYFLFSFFWLVAILRSRREIETEGNKAGALPVSDTFRSSGQNLSATFEQQIENKKDD